MANEDKEKCCIKCRQCHTSMKITNSFICYTRTFSLISTFCSPPPHPHFSSCNIRLCLETSNQYALASKQFSYSFTIDSIVWCLIFSLLFFSLFQKLFVSPPHTHTYRASHRKQFFRSSHRVAVRYDSITYLLTSIISFLFGFLDIEYAMRHIHRNEGMSTKFFSLFQFLVAFIQYVMYIIEHIFTDFWHILKNCFNMP